MGYITLSNAGLLLNVLGSIFIAVSISKGPAEAYTEDDKGNKVYIAEIVNPKLIKIGLILLVLGFILQVKCVPS